MIFKRHRETENTSSEMGGKKGLNPVDAYRKEQKKKEHKKHQYEKRKTKETNKMVNNPEKIDSEIRRLQTESDHNKLDKGLKDQLRQLQAMKVVADNKKLSHLVPSQSPAVELPPPMQRPPEQSVYYDPQFNPLGTPPPGYPPMYRVGNEVAPPTHFATPSSQVLAPPPTSVVLPNYGYLNSFSVARPSIPTPPQVVFNPNPSITSHRIGNKSFVDPLDPSASGYNQRFGTEGQKRKRQILETLDHHKHLDAGSGQISSGDNQDKPQEAENTPSPTVSQESDLTPSVDVVPQGPDLDSTIPSINIAELMKRRKMIHLESSEVGPTLPPEVVGPTRPSLEEPQAAAPMANILGICYSSDSETEEVVPDTRNRNQNLPTTAEEETCHLSLPKFPQSDVLTDILPPKPKHIQVESELVHFVPSALRAKRTYPQSKSKALSQLPTAGDPYPRVMPQKHQNESVDAAYEEFMLEINQLGH